jgi:hydroxymethylpyrimidine/phosphomethylpyrimidine kinase
MSSMKTVLSIAGSDSGGGAGIQADLKTFSAFGVYGMTVITSVTAQNTVGVHGIYDLPASFVARQLKAVLADLPVDAAKTGMLSNAAIIRSVSRELRQYDLKNLVVDPVMVSKSGDRLLRENALRALQKDLLPLATVITPNIPEAEVLSGKKISGLEDMRRAAKVITSMGPRYVLVKGGHLRGGALDLLYDGNTFIIFRAKRIRTRHTHGTGCTLSAAIAAGLARGMEVPQAVSAAKDFITKAIQKALPLGHGHGPLNHFVRPKLLGSDDRGKRIEDFGF